jgi:hypothetical protein
MCSALRNPLQQRTRKNMDDILYTISKANIYVWKINFNTQGQHYKQDKITIHEMLITVKCFIKRDRMKNLN